jgi:hypothetical protein
LANLAKDLKTSVIQFSEPLDVKTITLLEQVVFSKRADIVLRVYGHYFQRCDLSFIEKIPSVRGLSIDCLRKVTNIDVVKRVPHLDGLHIGVFELDSFEFLDNIDRHLKRLSLYQTRSKKPRIEAIGRFTELNERFLEGQSKGIEAINELKKLEKIVMRSISTRDIEYLRYLELIWSVDIKLGGIKDLSALKSLPNLKYLEIWQVRGLSDLSVLSDLKSLQNLFIQSLPQLTVFPTISSLGKLRRIYLENLKCLMDLSELKSALALIEFNYLMAQNQNPENLIPVLENKSLERVYCYFGSDRKDIDFKKLAQSFGKDEYEYQKFVYN